MFLFGRKKDKSHMYFKVDCTNGQSLYYEYASFERRLIAATIDLIMVMAISAYFVDIINSLVHDPTQLSNLVMEVDDIRHGKKDYSDFYNIVMSKDFLYNFVIVQSIHLFVISIITLLFWIKYQTTPGKMFLSCKIMSNNDVEKPSSRVMLIRLIAAIFSSIIFGIGFFFILFSKRRQAMHDKVAGTIVVRSVGWNEYNKHCPQQYSEEEDKK